MSLQPGIPSLILKRLQGVITTAEDAVLDAWAAADPANRALLGRLLDEPQVMADTQAFDELWGGERGVVRYNRMEQATLADTAAPTKRLGRRWLPYVAAAVLLITLGTWLFVDDITTDRTNIACADDIAPGGNRATLTLTDGRVIDLSEAQAGIIIDDNEITYSDGVSLASAPNVGKQAGKVPQLVLTTPRGGTYRITLSDGTDVWLNSASTLKYPSKFEGSERVVELIGEAYFDVANAGEQGNEAPITRERPFRVVTDGQTVEVLGTEFNITAYPDESDVKTTLVEGRVQVATDDDRQSPIMLIPGQQSTARDGQIRVDVVDVQEYIAWKEGFFYFNGDSPQEAFAQLSRWYDIELAYPPNGAAVQFYGEIERNRSLGSLLKVLEGAGLEFEVVQTGSGFKLILGRE